MPYRHLSDPPSATSSPVLEREVTLSELANSLEVDVRFFRIALDAGLELNVNDTISPLHFWRWFCVNQEAFRHAAGMSTLKGPPKTVSHSLRLRLDAQNALFTVAHFFGVLPCEVALAQAKAVLLGYARR